MQHRNKKLSESVRLTIFKSVLLLQHFLEWPEIKTSDPPQIASTIKKLL